MKNVTIKKALIMLVCACCLMFSGLLLVNVKTAPVNTSADAVSFVMNDGASIRLQNTEDAKYNGFRFTANVSKATFDSWSGATYYMIIMPKSYEAKGAIDDEDSYVWNYDDVATSSGVFILGYDKPAYSGKGRVLYNQCNPVSMDASGNETDDPSKIASYELRASVVGMKAKNAATKYTAQCVVEKADGSRVFATRASEDKRYRSILDVSIRARESGKYSSYDTMLEAYENDYVTWYEGEHSGAAPTFSYTVKTYYNSTLMDTTPVSGQSVHATVDVTPTNYTGKSIDLVYFNDEGATNCDTVEVVDGKLQGYICADSEVELHIYYNDKTQHTFSLKYAESNPSSSFVGTNTLNFGTVYSGAYKMLVGASDLISDFNTSTFTLTLSNAKEFVPAKWGITRNVAIYCEKDYVTGTIQYVTTVFNNASELNQFGAIAEKIGRQTCSDIYGYWDGYYVLGNDIYFNDDYITWGYYEAFRANQGGDATGYANSSAYGFRGTFDGCGHVIDSMRVGYATVPIYGGTGRVAASAFISLLNKRGVIKSVAFTNCINYGNNSFLVNIGEGLVEDVYIKMAGQSNGNAGNNDRSGTICGNQAKEGMVIRRVFIDTTRYVFDGTNGYVLQTGAYSIGRLYDNASILQDVTVLSKLAAYESLGTGSGAANIYGRMECRDQLIAANPNYSGWVSTNPTMWSLDADNIVIPNRMLGKVYGGSDKVTVSIVDFSSDKCKITLPFSVSSSVNLSSISWNINQSIASAGTNVYVHYKTDFDRGNGGGRLGRQWLTVYDGGTLRWVEMICGTLVIKTKADLDRFPTVSKAYCSDKVYLYGGYFYLANNIDYGNGGYETFQMFAYYQKVVDEGWVAASGASAWNDTTKMGFCGVFDGLGYNIAGLRINPDASGSGVAGGFIGLLHKDGIIRNVSFTRGWLSGYSGYLTCGCGGTVEDVYIHLAKQKYGNASNRSSVIASQTRAENVGTAQSPIWQYTTRINRVYFVIDATDSFGSDYLYNVPIGEFYDAVVTTHGGNHIINVGGYGNIATKSATDYSWNRQRMGIRYLGASANTDGKLWQGTGVDKDAGYINALHHWVIGNCETQNHVFWKMNKHSWTYSEAITDSKGATVKAKGTTETIDYLTTRNLNGSDLTW